MASEPGLVIRNEQAERSLELQKRTKLSFAQRRSVWRMALKRSGTEFLRHESLLLAAALTYYSILSIFPAGIALVSLIGVFGDPETGTEQMLNIVSQLGFENARDGIAPILEQLNGASGAGIALAIGLVGAVFTASGYVSAFAIAMNRIYEVPEGRGVVKLKLQQMMLTLALIVLCVIVLFSLVVSGTLAEAIGGMIGLGSEAVTVWNFAKLPVILLIVMFMVGALYYFTPNVRQVGFRIFSLGAVIGVGVWVLLSVGFAFYLTNFGSYNKTYGALAGVIVFLLWIWITNIALLFGAEVDSEVSRGRQLLLGIKSERDLNLPLRDDTVAIAQDAKYDAVVGSARQVRQDAEQSTRRRLLGHQSTD